MNTKLKFIQRVVLLLLLLTLNHPLSTAHAQGNAFTYQGRLNGTNGPVTGAYDITLTLFDAASGGIVIGPSNVVSGLMVTNGLFTVTPDFGPQFNGSDRWLELAVRTNGSSTFFPLSPRQKLTPTPYSLYAPQANTATIAMSVSADAVNSSGLQSSSVNSDKIADGSITSADVNSASFSNTFWKVNGNAGTTPGAHFLGTTDNLPLEFKVNGQRALRLEPTATTNAINVIGGSPQNSASPGVEGVTIAGGGIGGFPNTITASYSTIGGGTFNMVAGGWSTIAGGRDNNVSGSHSTVSGGQLNTIQTNADFATIGGGKFNQATVNEATVAGGAFNSALAFSSTIGGGGGNAVSGAWATIAGGRANLLTNSDYATIGGGFQNTIQTNSSFATISGGVANTIQTNGYNSMIGGGHDNTIQSAAHSAIGGGGYNSIQFNAYDSVIGGGGYNTIQTNANSSFIGGGEANTAGSAGSVIAGGYYNTNIGFQAFIGAGNFNLVGIGGSYAFIGCGYQNTNNGYASFLGGGSENTIETNASSATIGGGSFNTIQAIASAATIGGGAFNAIQTNAIFAMIGGGAGNTIQALGNFATIPGGRSNSATSYAFAAGFRAKANHTGAFVWADSTDADFASSATNQFLVRANGGVGINKSNPATALDVNGTVTATSFSGSGAGLTGLNAANLSGSVPSAALTSVPAGNLTGTIADARLSSNVALRSGGNAFTGNQTITGGSVGIGITPQSTLDVNGTARIEGANNWGVSGGEGDFRVGNDTYRFKIGVANAGGGAGDVWMRAHGGIERINIKAPGGTRLLSNEAETSGVSLAAGGTAWAVISDRNVKKDFAPVDQRTILEKLAAMPITQWHYQWETSETTPHIGPMAQDFKAAFYPGTDDKSITTQEADGVAFAAIQGLNQKLAQQEAALKNKDSQIQELQFAVAELQKAVRKISSQD